MPNVRSPRSSSSITASLRVCMCTVGVSLYSSTASHPLSLFTAHPPSWGSLDHLLGPRERSVAVNLVEEQADCRRDRTGAGAVGHVERVAGARKLDIADHRVRGFAQLFDEAARLRNGDDAVAGAMDDEEGWCILVHAGDR